MTPRGILKAMMGRAATQIARRRLRKRAGLTLLERVVYAQYAAIVGQRTDADTWSAFCHFLDHPGLTVEQRQALSLYFSLVGSLAAAGAPAPDGKTPTQAAYLAAQQRHRQAIQVAGATGEIHAYLGPDATAIADLDQARLALMFESVAIATGRIALGVPPLSGPRTLSLLDAALIKIAAAIEAEPDLYRVACNAPEWQSNFTFWGWPTGRRLADMITPAKQAKELI